MKDLGPAELYLGIRIQRDRAKQAITIDQESYIQDALVRFRLEDTHPPTIPLPSSVHYKASTNEASSSLQHQYQTIIGTLLYVMLGTRPDVAYAVTKLSTFNNNPSEVHLDATKRILKYLKGTSHYKILYKGSDQEGLIGYSDADHA